MNKFTETARAKGWTLKALAERWGVKRRAMSYISAKPRVRDWDGLEGLPDLKNDQPISKHGKMGL